MAAVETKAERPPRRTAGSGIVRTKATSNDAELANVKANFLSLARGWAEPSLNSIDQIRDGLSVEMLDGLNSVLPGVTDRIVPKNVLANPKKKSSRLSREQSDRFYQTGKVVGLAMAIYRDESKAREFLTRRHPMLKDKRPIDVALENGAGADLVINLLGRGAYGGGA